MAQRILIVDDDQKIVRLLRASLEQAGYQVFVAYNGETALHTLRRERPDLEVLDLMLPDRDGWLGVASFNSISTWELVTLCWNSRTGLRGATCSGLPGFLRLV